MNQDQTFNFMLAKVRGMLREESVLEDKDAIFLFCHTFRTPRRRRRRGSRFLHHLLGGMEEQCRQDTGRGEKETGSLKRVQMAELIGQKRSFKRP